MPRWFVLLLLASCGPKHDCAPAKAAATDALEAALRDVGALRQAAKPASSPARIDDLHRQLDEAIHIVDLGLDCPRLGKASAPDLVPIQSALLELKGSASQVPMPVGDALQPVIALYDANLGLLSGPSPKIAAWCASMREALASVKQNTPPLWARAKASAEAERADADAKLAAIRDREKVIRAMLEAVQASRPVTPPAGKDELTTALDAYQAACQ
ncbi:MAG: hypothetical protein ABI678_15830 [Kofleriaceae bacterium]